MLKPNDRSLPEPSALAELLAAATANDIDQGGFIGQFVSLSKSSNRDKANRGKFSLLAGCAG